MGRLRKHDKLVDFADTLKVLRNRLGEHKNDYVHESATLDLNIVFLDMKRTRWKEYEYIIQADPAELGPSSIDWYRSLAIGVVRRFRYWR